MTMFLAVLVAVSPLVAAAWAGPMGKRRWMDDWMVGA
jgi:hypothetical protein